MVNKDEELPAIVSRLLNLAKDESNFNYYDPNPKIGSNRMPKKKRNKKKK